MKRFLVDFVELCFFQLVKVRVLFSFIRNHNWIFRSSHFTILFTILIVAQHVNHLVNEFSSHPPQHSPQYNAASSFTELSIKCNLMIVFGCNFGFSSWVCAFWIHHRIFKTTWSVLLSVNMTSISMFFSLSRSIVYLEIFRDTQSDLEIGLRKATRQSALFLLVLTCFLAPVAFDSNSISNFSSIMYRRRWITYNHHLLSAFRFVFHIHMYVCSMFGTNEARWWEIKSFVKIFWHLENYLWYFLEFSGNFAVTVAAERSCQSLVKVNFS